MFTVSMVALIMPFNWHNLLTSKARCLCNMATLGFVLINVYRQSVVLVADCDVRFVLNAAHVCFTTAKRSVRAVQVVIVVQ